MTIEDIQFKIIENETETKIIGTYKKHQTIASIQADRFEELNELMKKFNTNVMDVTKNVILESFKREKVDRKRMSKSVNNPSHDDNLIQQSGLAECQEIILKNFNLFKSTFGLKDKSEKNLLVTKFNQLFAYRNAFMHDKPIKNDEVIMNEGKAALVWFKRVLNETNGDF